MQGPQTAAMVLGWAQACNHGISGEKNRGHLAIFDYIEFSGAFPMVAPNSTALVKALNASIWLDAARASPTTVQSVFCVEVGGGAVT